MAGTVDIRTLAELPRRNTEARSDAPALWHAGRMTTFAELDERSNRVANGILEAGMQPGDRVAFLGRDSDHAFEVIFGCARAGAVWMGINWRLAPPEIGFILNDGEAKLLFVEREFADLAKRLQPELPELATVVFMDDFVTWRNSHSGDDTGIAVDEEDVVAQMYTSGTTGHPKGVMLAHRSFFAVVRNMRRVGDPWIGWSDHDVSLLAIPSFHIGGIWWAMTTLSAGAQLVVMPAFSARQSLELIADRRVTKTCMVPAMLQVILSEPGCAETDFASLGCIVYGGSPIPRPFLEKAIAVFGCGFAQIYGLTETGNTAVCLRPEDHRRPELLIAAGRPYPGVRLKCIDAHGNEVPAGELGEVCIRSPANMVGYWQREDATRETLRDGWVHTGDAGHIDGEGYLFVSDRIKDMILYAGENVYPAEIESVLCGHPAIAEAAVIGVPDDRWGELVKAIVVLRPAHSATEREIMQHCRGKLAVFKVPKSVDFAAALPRTPSGKIQKAKLREPYWRGRERRVN